MADEELRRGPLHDLHARLGARFVGFSGFEMPVMYSGIKEEHNRVRRAVGIFDVSHMSNLRIEGPGATELLTLSLPARVDKLATGRGVYTVILDDDGMILDDTIVYRLGKDRYAMVPNAGMNEKVMTRLERNARPVEDEVAITDTTRSTCIFALQGPRAPHVLGSLGLHVPDEPRFAAHEKTFDGADVIVTTTGYTGETGYELFVHDTHGPALFEALLDHGRTQEILPCGLGARDTLRLEMGYCLAGHEFKGGRTPLEAGLGWTIKWDHEFVGREALEALKEEGGYDRLVGIEMTGRGGVPREGYAILDAAGTERLGHLTSGTLSPTLEKGIALAYLPPEHAKPGNKVQVEVRGKGIDALIVKPPFLKK